MEASRVLDAIGRCTVPAAASRLLRLFEKTTTILCCSMKRVAWLTDIHLNFVASERSGGLLDHLRGENVDAVLIGGDIAESHDVAQWLGRFEERVRRPVYFVLGNHDFYRGSIAGVRDEVAEFCRDRSRLTYLTRSEPVELTPRVGLIGHDGWADGRAGNYPESPVMLNDYKLIDELAGIGKQQRWSLLKALGDEAADHIRRVLPAALAHYEHVCLLTHVPPLREACWHEGHISDDDWAPHFTCQAMGGVILSVMRDRPKRRLTVLCGHTHSRGEIRPLENVVILTGKAEYGAPIVERMFEWD